MFSVLADSVTTITGLKAGNDKAFIDAKGGVITVSEGAKLDISKLDKVADKDYFIADNYADCGMKMSWHMIEQRASPLL